MPAALQSDNSLFGVLLDNVEPEKAQQLIVRQFAYMAAINYHAMVMNSGRANPPRPDTVRETALRLEQYFGGTA